MDDRLRRIHQLGNEPPAREITPERLYQQRRQFLAGATALGLGVTSVEAHAGTAKTPELTNLKPSPLSTKGETPTPWDDATSYNNFYEFGTGKADPAANAHSLKPRPWTVVCEGEVKKPQRF